MTKDKITFEQSLLNLESIVQKLEKGEVPLEEAIEYYKEGLKYSKLCHDKLKQAEKQIVQFVNDEGQVEPFKASEGE
ncbi:MAG: exodeoxyribonuclease small subunit [Bacillales bacterium]|nr:exodeoxyribonuclease small subunit [Bacillales bacterium]